ncbi:MAG TPA: hypothetical protein VFZ61_11270, partial [Polyangiales bacterium]
ELLARATPSEFAQRVRTKSEREARRSAHVPLRRLTLGVAMLAVVALAGRQALTPDADSTGGAHGEKMGESGERAKGLQPSLRVYRKRPEAPELLPDGAQVSAGDVLQLGYLAPGMTHAVLLSIDGRGAVTLHFPREGESGRIPAAQGEQLLAASYELDDAPRFERFFLLTAPRVLRAADALRAAEKLGRRREARGQAELDLPGDVVQSSVLLRKAEP